ncbi:MAG: MFS transporter [Gammaproteobacteria bacterium]|nr:MFS transporter [Zhongshania sp.]MBU0538444.1 MFS transporter [Gammaproteobacteria bacterium]MBU1831206.1 MFS transporter [Gammaproteobacteria bacterium]
MRSPFQYWRFVRYALPGLPLAALGLPFYIYAPLWLAEQGGYGYALVGAIFFLARISDVVSDLPVGAWVDRRGSHRLLWLGAWALIAGSALALTLIPHPWPPLLLGLVLVLLMLGWTGVTVPWLALPVNLSRRNIDRLRYNSSREAMLLLGTLMAMLVPAILAPSALPWALAALLLVLLLAVCLQGGQGAADVVDKTLSFKVILADSRVRSLALPWFVNMLANAIPGTVLLLFMREVLDAEDAVPLALLSYFLAGLIGVPFWYFLARKIGDLKSWRIGLCSSAILFSFAALLGDGDVAWFIAISVGTGLALGADQALPSAMQTGLAQALSQEQGGAALGARMFALWSMLSKAAMGLAVGVSYLWLGSQVDIKVPPVWAITAVYVVAPVVLKLLVFFMLGRTPVAWIEKRQEYESE